MTPKKRRLSYSAFKELEDCSKRYYFNRIAKLSKEEDTSRYIHGTVIQSVIENWINKGEHLNPKTARKWLKDNLETTYLTIPDRHKAKWKTPTDEGKMLDVCRTALDVFVDGVNEWKFLTKNTRCEIEVGGDISPTRHIWGRVDFWIERRDELPFILDGKATAKKIPSNDQLIYYALATNKSRGFMPKLGFLYYKLGKLDMVDYSTQDLNALEERIHESFQVLETEAWKANPTNENCFFCEFKESCQEYKDTVGKKYQKADPLPFKGVMEL